MDRKLLLLFIIISFSAQGQDLEPSRLFSQAIGKNIKTYRINSKQAYADNDFKRAEMLFDSFIKKVVNGSTLDNFPIRKISGKRKKLYDYKKPIFLITYASWCTPGVGEIPALNAVARKHYKDIDFIVLFWDTKKNARKLGRAYDNKIQVVYINELENTNSTAIKTMKHSLGFPTSFFIDANKKILDVRRGALHPYHEEYEISFELNYNSFLNGISMLKTLPSQNEISAVDTP
ncbi:TlpA family protein disulfide reductase [Patiriisocius sp. Uisw_017]|jgi:thiol-disulfide isomerase/thioredoxin|uniref:TlpA family protein disulfide reductase n=1 Tax=Patiriisocius sp. Uisw_017 TaxID=3230968 RepID=UPI0039E9C41C